MSEPGTVDTPVVIVGAGPIGMSTALLLARAGVSSVLLDRRTTASCEQSRAITIQRDLLALFDRLGIVGPILDGGVSWSLGRTYFHDQEILQLHFPPHGEDVYPAFVNYPQYHVEQLLFDALGTTPAADLHLGRTAVGFDQDDDGVTVTAEGPGGTETYRARYLVGADGLGSRVRKHLGIDYEGWATQGRFVVADFEADLPFAYERRLWFSPPFYPDGIVLMHGLDKTGWRLDWQIPVDADADALIDFAEVERRIHAAIGDYPVRVKRSNAYTFQQRQAARFRSGRMFLVGDAAHVVSPFGARGMNSGLEDADNLAWKLARVLHGESDETLLDSYERERAAAARHHVAVTGASMTFMTPGDAAGIARRDEVLAAAAADPARAAEVDSGKLYEPYPYRDSPLTALLAPDGTTLELAAAVDEEAPDETLPGEIAPDGRCHHNGTATTLRKALGGRLSVLAVPGRGNDASALVSELAARLGVGFTVLTRGEALPDGVDHLVDATGTLSDLFAGERDRVYVVRPDCYLAVRADLDPAGLPAAALARHCYDIAAGRAGAHSLPAGR